MLYQVMVYNLVCEHRCRDVKYVIMSLNQMKGCVYMKPILIPSFTPVGFNEAFYGSETVPPKERNNLFHYLFFDRASNETDSLLRSILQGQTGYDYSFLATSCVDRKGNVNYRNPRIVTYLIDFLTQNNAEQFYLFLYRVETIWKEKKNSKSALMKSKLHYYFHSTEETTSKYDQSLMFLSEEISSITVKINEENSNIDKLKEELKGISKDDEPELYKAKEKEIQKSEQTLSSLTDRLCEIDDVRDYFSYIDTFNAAKPLWEDEKGTKRIKPAYAYALMILWAVLNVDVIHLIDYIKQIIVYEDEPTTSYDHNKRYIIRSALNDNLFISVQKTKEPLSDGEGFKNEREMLFSVNSGKFHIPTSIFRMVKCSVYDRHRRDTPHEMNTETALINEKAVAKLLKLAQQYFKPGVPDLATSIFPKKTEPYYIMVENKFLTYGSWFSQTRVVLKEHCESGSKWRFTKSPNIVGIFNQGQMVDLFALDVPNGAQGVSSVMWCFPHFSQAAQRFCIHEVIDWRSIHEERNG